jgi:hypothetical protein
MPNDLSGAELDARFFEVCGYRKEIWDTTYNHQRGQEIVYVPVEAPPKSEWDSGSDWWHRVCYAMREWRGGKVSTDANHCEAWAMRWAREQGLLWNLRSRTIPGVVAKLFGEPLKNNPLTRPQNFVRAEGKTFMESFVRACVAAGEILNQSKGQT